MYAYSAHLKSRCAFRTLFLLALPNLCSAVLQSASCHIDFEIHSYLDAFDCRFISASPLRSVNAASPSVCGLTFGVANVHCVLLTVYLQFRRALSPQITVGTI